MEFLIFIFGLLSVSSGSEKRNIYGPKCLSCIGERDPTVCTTVTSCWASQKCYSERYTHADGHFLYDFGCKIKEECDLLSESRNRRLDITIDVCEECCDGEFCNVNTCVNRTETASVACYSCDDQDNPYDCHKLDRCGQNEMCYAEKVITDSPHPRYTLGCLSQQVCSYLDNGAQPIGKRSTHLCQKCCSTSGCNVDVCGDSQQQQTTTMVTPEPTTAGFYTSIPTATPSYHDVRLVNGRSHNKGRVELFYNGQWGTICDDGFGAADAGVVCHMLGYQRAGAVSLNRAHFGQGTGPIWLDDMACDGNEEDILSCPHKQPIGAHNCQHSEDAGVACLPYVRLVNGTSNNEGRVEILYNGQWGTICDDSFGYDEASVICHITGFRREGAIPWSGAHFGQGFGEIWLDDVACDGNETDILNCNYTQPIGTNNCGHREDVGVTCVPHVRLVNGTSSNEGRVEIFHNGQWGTICDDYFESEEASVICHMAGYQRAGAVALIAAHFGHGTGPIWLDNVACVGNEEDILNCRYAEPIGTNDCDHSEDVGVKCMGPLLGLASDEKGRSLI